MEATQREMPSHVGPIFAGVQLGLVVAWVVILSGVQEDATATSIDWLDVSLDVAIPSTFALSFWMARALNNRVPLSARIVTRVFVRFAYWTTLVILVLTLVWAPLDILVAITIEPIG